MAKKTTSFADKKPEELVKLLASTREELRVLRFQAAGSRPKDSNSPRKSRKDIARILTALTAKKNAA